MTINFQITHTDGKTRRGVVQTNHGDFNTPTITVNFTPALMRSGLKPSDVKELGVELVLVNTLHAYLAKVSDVHDYLGWQGPVLADSGGFQMISLSDKLTTTREGVAFELDGEKHFFTPASVLATQRQMGIDMMMPLDYVVSVRKKSLGLFLKAWWWTKKWFLPAAKTGTENLYYIVQGGTSSLARTLSVWDANRWLKKGVQAVALGGISLGEKKTEIYETVRFCCTRLVTGKPRHLLGVGDPQDLVECIARGIDTFDCVSTTRLARHGVLWTSAGVLRLKQSRYTDDQVVLDSECDCPTCTSGETRAALRAGLKSVDENLVREAKLKLMKHNIRFVMRLMANAREAIAEGAFEAYRQKITSRFS